MLQSVLSGKAAEVYLALSTEQSSDYDFVKREILKAYELVPETYRQKLGLARNMNIKLMLNLINGLPSNKNWQKFW